MQQIPVSCHSLRTFADFLSMPQVTVNRVCDKPTFEYRFRSEDSVHIVDLPAVGRLVSYQSTDQQTSCTYVITKVEPFRTGLNQGRPRYAFIKPVTAISLECVQYASTAIELRIQLNYNKGTCRWVEEAPRDLRVFPSFTFDTIKELNDGSYNDEGDDELVVIEEEE